MGEDHSNGNTHAPRVRSVLVLLLLAMVVAAPARGEDVGRPQLVFSTFSSEGMGELFVRILTEAYGHLGFDVVFNRFPAQRCLVMADLGLVDGEAGRVPVIEADFHNLIRVPTPIYTNRVVVFTKRKDIDTSKGWDAIRPFSLCSIIGYRYIERQTRGMRRTLVTDYRKLFAMLARDRVDAAVVSYIDALPNFRPHKLTDVLMLEPPLASKLMYHYLHKRHEKLVPLIDAELQAMRRDGRMEFIRLKLLEEFRNR